MRKLALFVFSVLFLSAGAALAGNVITPGAIIGATPDDLRTCASMFRDSDLTGLEKMANKNRCGFVMDPIQVKLVEHSVRGISKVRVRGEGMEVWVHDEFLK